MIVRRRFRAGETILRENDLGETAYVIDTGQVDISKQVGGRVIHLARLGPGDTIGEMSMIDDMPRSATAVAVEPTELREIHQDGFYEALRTDPELTVLVLKALFERLREANSTILQLRMAAAAPDGSEEGPELGQEETAPVVLLRGLTPEAEQALPISPFRIERFPFRIGRLSRNPLVHNDLTIEDQVPWQISRHHLAFVLHEGQVGVVDRGSRLGSEVDDRRLGGRAGDPGPLLFSGPEGTLVLGKSKSPFRFQVTIQGQPPPGKPGPRDAS